MISVGTVAVAVRDGRREEGRVAIGIAISFSQTEQRGSRTSPLDDIVTLSWLTQQQAPLEQPRRENPDLGVITPKLELVGGRRG